MRALWTRIGLRVHRVRASRSSGFWAAFAPRSFYADFPGAGRHWISPDGPYNQHLIRDVGELNLALFVVVLAAAVTLSLPLVRAALAGDARERGAARRVPRRARRHVLVERSDRDHRQPGAGAGRGAGAAGDVSARVPPGRASPRSAASA